MKQKKVYNYLTLLKNVLIVVLILLLIIVVVYNSYNNFYENNNNLKIVYLNGKNVKIINKNRNYEIKKEVIIYNDTNQPQTYSILLTNVKKSSNNKNISYKITGIKGTNISQKERLLPVMDKKAFSSITIDRKTIHKYEIIFSYKKTNEKEASYFGEISISNDGANTKNYY